MTAWSGPSSPTPMTYASGWRGLMRRLRLVGTIFSTGMATRTPMVGSQALKNFRVYYGFAPDDVYAVGERSFITTEVSGSPSAA